MINKIYSTIYYLILMLYNSDNSVNIMKTTEKPLRVFRKVKGINKPQKKVIKLYVLDMKVLIEKNPLIIQQTLSCIVMLVMYNKY